MMGDKKVPLIVYECGTRISRRGTITQLYRLYFSSIAFTFSTLVASSFSRLALNHASIISFAIIGEVSLRLIANTFASFHLRAPLAVSASAHKAALIPGTLFAAMLTPVPVQQNSIPWSQFPSETVSATF